MNGFPSGSSAVFPFGIFSRISGTIEVFPLRVVGFGMSLVSIIFIFSNIFCFSIFSPFCSMIIIYLFIWFSFFCFFLVCSSMESGILDIVLGLLFVVSMCGYIFGMYILVVMLLLSFVFFLLLFFVAVVA